MSKHTSPYHAAGSLLSEHLRGRRGLKSLAFDDAKKNAPNKATYATVCRTVQCLPALHAILDDNNKKLRKAVGFDAVRNKGLLYVMLYELLFGKYQSIRGGGKIKRMIVKHEKELRRGAEAYVAQHGEVLGASSGGVSFPRYVRVNTLKASVSEVVETLRDELSKREGAEGKNDDANEEPPAPIYADPHVPDLLVLPPSASSWLHHDHALVKAGRVVLQDKSSCFSALALAHGLDGEPTEGYDCIDACAAPGNKTSHLAALVSASLGHAPAKKKRKSNKAHSTIHAFERNSARHAVLSQRMEQLVPPSANVEVAPIHGDFLKSDPVQFANVRAIMLDPSCSGSGIVTSPDRAGDDATNETNETKGKDKSRIQSLANFQLVALKHAMSFPRVERIVYSTCSVHIEENEGVVAQALAETGKSDEDGNEWTLVPPQSLAQWKRRGKAERGLTADQAKCLVRCDGTDGDETNGFFVALFVRKRVLAAVEERRGREPRRAAEERSIPLYTGQFATATTKTTDAANDSKSEDADAKDSTAPCTKSQAQKPKKTPPPSTTKATDKSAKKREKKMAWKRKQALLKAARLKKKEEASQGLVVK